MSDVEGMPPVPQKPLRKRSRADGKRTKRRRREKGVRSGSCKASAAENATLRLSQSPLLLIPNDEGVRRSGAPVRAPLRIDASSGEDEYFITSSSLQRNMPGANFFSVARHSEDEEGIDDALTEHLKRV